MLRGSTEAPDEVSTGGARASRPPRVKGAGRTLFSVCVQFPVHFRVYLIKFVMTLLALYFVAA